jgi:hypothetical protein
MKNPAILKELSVSGIFYWHYRICLPLIIMVISLFSGATAWAQVGVHTDFPDASSAMEIYSTNKGLLIPRVTLSENLDSPSPITSPAVGLLVFNSGPNQPMGFYYWDGSLWISTSGVAGNDYWLLKGNTGTEVGTNFLGTTDLEDLAIYTNSLERMRVEQDGQVIIGSPTPMTATDILTVVGNVTQNYAISAFSPSVGMFADADGTCFRATGGRYGFVSIMDSTTGYSFYGRNTDPVGWGLITAGGNTSPNVIPNHTGGVSSTGPDGLYTDAISTTGTGIIALGTNVPNAALLSSGSGGALSGYHGTFSKGTNSSGIGIIAVGNNGSNYWTSTSGGGGTFTGYHGVYTIGTNVAAGTGIIAVGNNLGSYNTVGTGSGGAFTGSSNGATGWGSNSGLTGWGQNATSGSGILAAGNGLSPQSLTTGSGGAFRGTETGSVSWSTAAAGTGVVGAGNNATPIYYTGVGSGGAFTGTVCGTYGWATNTTGIRYGGYFATAPSGGAYAYVGYRNGTTNSKIVGAGAVSTIVKNTKGELITLTCPEAPEVVFQDYGIGKLENGKAHITIDPDLAINLNVSEQHPLKVFITLEGDCKGVFVTNKSAQGFDVIELQGGKSNVSFSWQIVATRANETLVLKDGTIEISDYSKRFQPAPGPLEVSELKTEQSVSGKNEQLYIQKPIETDQQIIINKQPVEEIAPDGKPVK